ncbi:MAG: TPM domain-containing protein [Chitinophagaceae bacterium]
MRLLDFIRPKPKDLFTNAEEQLIVEAVRTAERRTSGEVRVFIESRCRFVDATDRAAEVFFVLKMDQTELRNGTLVYVAVKDKQMAVFGDQGIHARVGTTFWDAEVRKMMPHFRNDNLPAGIIAAIKDIGEALHTHFPYDADTDKNELPDDIVFGK